MHRPMNIARILFLMVVIALTAFSSSAMADNEVPPPACQAPEIPNRFTSGTQVDQFMTVAKEYRACMETYARLHEDMAQRHTTAANKALEDWNAYAEKINAKSREQKQEQKQKQEEQKSEEQPPLK